MGFADPGQAGRLLGDGLGLDAEEASGAGTALLDAVAAAADPDLALAALARLPPDQELRAALRADTGLRVRLTAVLGASAALGDHLTRHPGDWQVLRGEEPLPVPTAADLRADLLTAVGADPAQPGPLAGRPGFGTRGGGPGAYGDGGTAVEPAVALRAAYRRRLLSLAARDLTGEATLDQVAAELADLAAAALEAALAVARSQLTASAAPCRLAVVAMGKCGARELNYASDVDVVFVAEPESALGTATRLATGLINVCSQSTTEGPLFPVDPNLRPEGRDGPLVRTLASYRAYYQRWAKTWEFQALLKARPVAGDRGLGQDAVDALGPLVWQAAQRENFVADVQAMRRRVVGTLPAARADREIKLGPGGLRDVEFAVQLLQLVHGRTDESLREPATLPALAALAEGGYVGREDAARLAEAYRFLRRLEHLLQLRNLRRTHTLPDDESALRRIGRALRRMQAGAPEADPVSTGVLWAQTAMGTAGLAYRPAGPAVSRMSPRGDPAEELLTQWRLHTREVRRLHEKLFYRPLLDVAATLPSEAAGLTPQAAQARLEALGYADPAAALRHIEALTSGVSRRAAIQRTLLPLMLGWFADSPDPDAGLLAFRQCSDALGRTPWYLRLLRDDMSVAQRMARVLAASRYATDLLLRQPEMVGLLRDDAELTPPPRPALAAEATFAVSRHAGAEDAVGAVRALRRRELLRAAAADLLSRTQVEETGETLTTVTAVTVQAALQVALRSAETALGGPLPTRLCVIAMGRFGGHETGYGSDADVMFVHDPLPGAPEREATDAAHAVAEDLRRLLARPAPDPPLVIDPGLRPEGRQGPLVRTLASYRAYYERWSVPWEAQALLRAEPTAGDQALGERFTSLADEFRYPAHGIPDASVREIRRLKARMEAERMPRGVDPALHLKLGPGGLSDVEWVVQLFQLRYAHAVPGLRTTQTLAGLAAAVAAGLAPGDGAAALAAAWRLATRVRNAVVLVRGRPADVIPSRQQERAAVASVLGYPPGAWQEMVQDYRRAARRARTVMEQLFYG
ncbi:MAG TPA: bifunctional [glutamine synthetase] adenylyltransferase/[glutamine synthetase]-adenylyl-L-tyrosine phosphorylase [Streptosporangiaceae bacterium]|nr:bifunctional [glutamine synthetase] adenylyltransferase/[glutamine synthetase]-adenylyl-L-tyrosine phosphorylase [Streptosporangiaceae bacterium]